MKGPRNETAINEKTSLQKTSILAKKAAHEMNHETITLPRSVVEQALAALFMYKPMVTGVTFQHGLDAMQELRAALEQPQVNSPEIPEGWKLVPVKPTEDMLNAVAWPGCAATDWEHMLAAAPQPPVVEQPQVEQEPVELRHLRALNQELLEALEKISAIENQEYGADWEEIEEARDIADAAIAKATGETK